MTPSSNKFWIRTPSYVGPDRRMKMRTMGPYSNTPHDVLRGLCPAARLFYGNVNLGFAHRFVA